MTVIAVTGCSGHIGTQLLHILDQSDQIDKIVGVDLKPPQGDFKKLFFTKMDIRDNALGELFRSRKVNQVVHLAYLIESDVHDRKFTYDVDVNGTQNILKATAYCEAEHLIVTSSTTAFGAFPDNPQFLKENDPIRKPHNYPYAENKYEVEQITKEFKIKNSEIKIAVVRPTVVLGPHVSNRYIKRILLRSGIQVAVSGSTPDLQYVHEDDVASLFYKIILVKEQGYFHSVGEGLVTTKEMCALTGKRIINFPAWLAYSLMKLLWLLHAPAIGPSGMLDYLRYRWIASDEITRKELNYKPRYTSLDSLKITLAAYRDS